MLPRVDPILTCTYPDAFENWDVGPGGYPHGHGRAVHGHAIGRTVSEAVLERDLQCRVECLRAVCEAWAGEAARIIGDIACPGERGRIGGVLLVTPIEHRLADVECGCGHDEQDEDRDGEDDDGLPAFAGSISG